MKIKSLSFSLRFLCLPLISLSLLLSVSACGIELIKKQATDTVDQIQANIDEKKVKIVETVEEKADEAIKDTKNAVNQKLESTIDEIKNDIKDTVNQEIDNKATKIQDNLTIQ